MTEGSQRATKWIQYSAAGLTSVSIAAFVYRFYRQSAEADELIRRALDAGNH